MRRVLMLLIAAVAAVAALVVVGPSAAAAKPVCLAPIAGYAYDAPIYDDATS